MADQDTPDLDLNTLIPLLQSRQNQEAATQQSKAALGFAGKIAAPNLYDMITQPQQHQPLPNPGGPPGKVPPQQGMDPRMPAALQEIGTLGGAGAAGKMLGAGARLAAPAAEAAGGLQAATNAVGRLGAAANEAGPAKAIAGAALQAPDMLNPTNPAVAATRLTPEQRQEIEKQKQLQSITNQGAAEAAKAKNEADLARINAENQAKLQSSAAAAEQERKNKEADALLQRQLQQQSEADAEAKAKKAREEPFVSAHPYLAKSLPALGTGAATLLPAWMKSRGKVPLEQFVKDWAAADKAATTALKGKLKQPAVAAAEKLRDYENKWPDMEKRFTPGWKTNSAAAFVPAELAAVPTEMDYTQPPDSPSRPHTPELLDTAGRAAGFGGLGAFGSKLGPAMVNPVAPFTGGAGTVKAYERKYPPTKTELAAQAARATIPQAPTKAMLPAILSRLRGK